MKYKTLTFVLAGALLVCCFAGWMPRTRQQDNTPPKVVIRTPAANEAFNWNELVRYSITVEDKEDGSSAYEEIAANEVFLKVQFVPDSTNLKAIRAEAKKGEPRELTLIKSSDCLNCHAFKSKVIGPSFETMAKQYATKVDAVALLSKKVINGSQASTGTEKMPAHPDLANGDAAAIVRWILKNAADPNVDYLRGLEGSFRTQTTPPKKAARAVYLLTATYIDHGLSNQPTTRKQGSYAMVLRSK